MEKRVCHYALNRIKQLIIGGKYSITKSAMRTALQNFSFLEEDILKEILNLENDSFYKSMTVHSDHTLWQDVYKKQIKDTRAYIKIQIASENTVIISFKNEVEA